MGSGLQVLQVSHEDIVMAIAFSPDGQYLATAGLDLTAKVWEISSGLQVLQVSHEDIVMAIAFSPDGQYLATASEDSTAQVWETKTGRKIVCITHKDSVSKVGFSADGKYLISITGNKIFPLATLYTTRTTCLWELCTGRKVICIIHDYGVNAVAFSPDRKYLAIASSDRTVGVWKATTRTLGGHHRVACTQSVANLSTVRMAHSHPIADITFSPDGKYLATASLDGTARVWEMASAQETACVIHGSEINIAIFSPDGQYLTTASDDHTVRVWKINSGQEITCMALDAKVNDIAFSPNGKFLATASGDLMSAKQDYSVQVWLWHPDDIARRSSQFNPIKS